MALIKKYRIQEKGEILLDNKPIEIETYEEPEEAFVAQQNIEPDNRVFNEKNDISETEQRAREIISKAQSEVSTIKEKAYKDGIALGKQEAAQKLKEALDTINQAMDQRKKIIKDSEAEILRIALKAAEQIIRSEVSLHRDVCLNIVSDAINRVSDREQIIIRVNREDAEYIKRYKDRLSGIVDGVKSLSILEDSQIEPGGCIIETNLGYVDARISTKLESLEEALKKTSEESN